MQLKLPWIVLNRVLVRLSLCVNKSDLDFDGSMSGSELQGVGEEIKEDLKVPVVIASYGHEIPDVLLVVGIVHVYSLLLCRELEGVQGLLYDFVKVKIGRVQVEGLVFYLRQVEQVVDEVEKHGRAEERVFQKRFTLLLILLGEYKPLELLERIVITKTGH